MTDQRTDQYVVIGHPVAHSKSPRIHGYFARQTGQNMHYGTLLAPLDGFVAAVTAFRDGGGCGMNVTVPFKEEAFRLATRLSPRARAAGAVNTLSFRQADIEGDNTDGAGLVRDIRDNLGVSLAGKRILLLGAGGAARGVLLPLQQQAPATLVIANRTAARAQALVHCLQGQGTTLRACSFEALAGEIATDGAFEIVINATSAGLSEATLPLPGGVFQPGGLAYDMMYGRQTPFMQQAQQAGARVADGLGMLVEQAAEAFWVWRGIRPQTAALLDELRHS
ncbi:MAG: shikimate dehydrogenase [Sterolibacterium sp.]|nr:shikimate dehydrogenase [Sterolibacterium sp.]